MNIYLMGMMGSGKSMVGKTLSQQLGKPFIDLDSEIEQSVGKTISEIFENLFVKTEISIPLSHVYHTISL